MKKNLLSLLLLTLIFNLGVSPETSILKPSLSVHEYLQSRTVAGTIKNDEGEPLAGASIEIKDTKKGTMTDLKGQFKLVLDTAVKKLIIHAYGYEIKVLDLTEEAYYEILLKKANPLDEEVVNNFRKKSARKTPGVVMESKAIPSTPVEVDYAGYSEGVIIDSEPVKSTSPRPEKESNIFKAGQLTAGEWNDLYHWEKWNTLVSESDYREMGDYWNIHPRNRVSVYVGNQYELPLSDSEVILMEKDDVIWRSKSDNSGKAELWYKDGQFPTKIVVRSGKKSKEIDHVKDIRHGVNQIYFDQECITSSKADIMFVVDATGSMGDEINFLKSELTDVIGRVKGFREDIEYRWGAVFYRDQTDEYLTRQLPFTNNVNELTEFIKVQNAGGGGDYPEAVTEGLEEALIQEWNPEAVSRIIFLVLDAPPHHNAESLRSLQEQIELAAAMGIKIIPITASGINRQTEYLMKFMSIMTNGTYVFLTDDSGIGNHHLEHIDKNYEVEKLNDLLIRLIINYSDRGRCIDQGEIDDRIVHASFSPNPVIDMLNIKAPEGTSGIRLISNSGQVIAQIDAEGKGDYQLNMESYIDGMYLIQILNEKDQYTYKVIKSGKG